jgi:hypothetical protein
MEVNPQIRELIIAYFATAVPFLGALLLLRAQGRAYFRWPVYSVMVMVLGVVLWNLIHRQLPAAWSVTHAAALYYGALMLYVVLGFGMGLLLGRLTRRKTPRGDSPDDPPDNPPENLPDNPGQSNEAP